MLQNIINLIYPPRCALCHNILKHSEEKGICTKCELALENERLDGARCYKCSRPIKNGRDLCLNCYKEQYDYTKGWSLYSYEGKIKESIYRFKYKGYKEYGKFYGYAMSHVYGGQIGQHKIDLIIPVPIHKKRRTKRGFNQSIEIAKWLSFYTTIPYDSRHLIRHKNTLPQSNLPLLSRKNNLSGAFKVIKKYPNHIKNVLLVDDIYTTGSTINHCARQLIENGVEKVYFISIAITNS